MEGVLEYANSDAYHRHISGVVLFSTANVRALWEVLERTTDVPGMMRRLFDEEPELMFSDHDFYGIAVDYGLFDHVVPTVPHDNLLGWYNNHDYPEFHAFRAGAMWSMCQRYERYPTEAEYRAFMEEMAATLGTRLPAGIR